MDILTPAECQELMDYDYEWKDLNVTKWSGGTLKFKTADCDFWQKRYPYMLHGCVNRYEVGDYAQEHKDSNWKNKNPGFQAMNVWITPLNNDYKGVELYFNGELIEQVIGVPVKYRINIPHEITEVTEGTRYSLVSWVFSPNKSKK